MKPKSVTHAHLLNCLRTRILSNPQVEKVRILEAGCGNGYLIEYLHFELRSTLPEIQFEIYGFDVLNHGVQQAGFLEMTVARLSALAPDVLWAERISGFSQSERWRYEDGFFDFIVSNQVLEHVQDKASFFQNTSRCLKYSGTSFHLAPLKHCIQEWHLWIPLAHRFSSFDALFGYIKFFSCLGVGKYKVHKKEFGTDVETYSRRHADYILFWTSYASQAETLAFVRGAQMRGDFRYTLDFYLLKLFQVFGAREPSYYRSSPSGLINWFAIRILRYVSSVTLTTHKRNEY